MGIEEVIENRRAYRSINPVEIKKDELIEIGRLVGLSASCFNKQPWRFVFVNEENILNGLKASLAKGNEWAKRSSLIIAVISSPNLDCILKERVYYLFDTGMATAYLILLLTKKGFVAHPIAGFNEGKVKDILGIHEDMTVISLIIVGKHANDIYPELSQQQKDFEINQPERMPVDDFVFFNKYGK